MSDHSPGLAQPVGSAAADGFVYTGLAEAVERATTSRFLLVRAAARLALAADAHVLPLVRPLRPVRRQASGYASTRSERGQARSAASDDRSFEPDGTANHTADGRPPARVRQSPRSDREPSAKADRPRR